MTEQDVLDVLRQGGAKPGFPRKNGGNEGSDYLIECAKRERQAYLWVLAWGPLTDVAQALHDAPEISRSIRLLSIGGWNTKSDPEARRYIYQHLGDKWPELWWIENGMFPGNHKLPPFFGYWYDKNPDGKYGSRGFLKRVIRGRGTDSNGRFEKKLGDAFPVARQGKLKRSDMLKEGDSPTFMYLLSSTIGNVGNPDDPTGESWGGRWYQPFPNSFPNYYTDLDTPPETYWNEIGKRTKIQSALLIFTVLCVSAISMAQSFDQDGEGIEIYTVRQGNCRIYVGQTAEFATLVWRG